jgi:2-hydroxymuconate-semialdehyde hydrolase
MNASVDSPEIGREIIAAGYRTNLHDHGRVAFR